jgi:hypothetical protein
MKLRDLKKILNFSQLPITLAFENKYECDWIYGLTIEDLMDYNDTIEVVWVDFFTTEVVIFIEELETLKR